MPKTYRKKGGKGTRKNSGQNGSLASFQKERN